MQADASLGALVGRSHRERHAATAVVQPRGGAERRLHVTRKGKHLMVAELPGKLRLIKAQ